MISHSRDKCIRRDYVTRSFRGVQLTIGKEVLSPGMLAACCGPDLDGKGDFSPVPSSRYARVYEFENGGARYFYKSYIHRTRLESVKALFRGTRAERAFRGHTLLRQNGLGAPRVVAFGRKGAHCFMISAALPEERGLGRAFSEAYPLPLSREGRALKRQALRSLGREIGRLHALGIFHGDLRQGNVLAEAVPPSPLRLQFLDNERTVQYRRLPDRKRLKNLVQLNIDSGPFATRTDRLRFFNAYLEENQALVPQKRRWIRRIVEKTAKRHDKRARKRAKATGAP